MNTTLVQPWQITNLALPKLLKLGRGVSQEDCTYSIRIAILGDAATQHYTQALGVTLKLRGFWLETYEAEYDAIELETFNRKSALYAHNTVVIVLANRLQALESRVAKTDNPVAFEQRVGRNGGLRAVGHLYRSPLDRLGDNGFFVVLAVQQKAWT